MSTESNCLPSLNEFLACDRPNVSYLNEPEFDQIYVRKGDIIVCVKGERLKCEKVITIANVVAKCRGQGILTRFIKRLTTLGYAVCIENAHSPRFQQGLLHRGFVLCSATDPTFLFNYKGHLCLPKSNCSRRGER